MGDTMNAYKLFCACLILASPAAFGMEENGAADRGWTGTAGDLAWSAAGTAGRGFNRSARYVGTRINRRARSAGRNFVRGADFYLSGYANEAAKHSPQVAVNAADAALRVVEPPVRTALACASDGVNALRNGASTLVNGSEHRIPLADFLRGHGKLAYQQMSPSAQAAVDVAGNGMKLAGRGIGAAGQGITWGLQAAGDAMIRRGNGAAPAVEHNGTDSESDDEGAAPAPAINPVEVSPAPSAPSSVAAPASEAGSDMPVVSALAADSPAPIATPAAMLTDDAEDLSGSLNSLFDGEKAKASPPTSPAPSAPSISTSQGGSSILLPMIGIAGLGALAVFIIYKIVQHNKDKAAARARAHTQAVAGNAIERALNARA